MFTKRFKPPAYNSYDLKYEKLVAANLKHIRAELLYTEHNQGDLLNSYASKGLVATIQNKLENVFSLISVTEGYIDEWESDLNRTPGLKHVEDSFNKLKSQFQQEVARAKQVAEAVKNRPPLPTADNNDDASTAESVYTTNVIDYNFINDAKSELDCDDRIVQHFAVPEYVEEDHKLTDSLIDQRDKGIHNIRSQLQQARDIFVDIATLVSVQDGGLQKLETNLKDAAKNSEETVYDIESITVGRRRVARRKRTWLYGISSVAVSLTLYYLHYMRLLL
ncbi:hypothetical protein BgAZ_403190 [Babesia gibsoni]|uniref:t-SNARE coiled-coil homology domain-containing protein n=1 Tax=Babesia gibsoni TaxID=33632 RepID=A0AAD8LHH4_BABGI|nr:hypothetical protein BgAZ_403190 [Babesia gibsoni]